MKIINLAIALLLLFHIKLFSQENETLFFIDIPFLEYPYTFNDKATSVDMQQSIRLSKSFYYASHFGIEKASQKWLGKRHQLWGRIIMTIFDSAPLPLSNTWLHEEWHRASLSVNDINSRNSHWNGTVKSVTDEDLIKLKLRSPADMVREATAGIEGNLEFVLEVQKDKFFGHSNIWTTGLYWGNYAVNSFYYFGATREGSKGLVKFKNSENSNPLDRDANGYDPINATYDLFNPNDAYENRGIHPSNVGIDRYVEFNDLSSDEQDFLKRQMYLSFLNFIDPNLIGFQAFGKNIKWNLTLRYQMTSFGNMVAGNIFLKNDEIGLIITPQFFKNKNKTFTGINFEVKKDMASLRIAGWQQPKNQSFHTEESQLRGLIGLSIVYPKKKLRPYLDLEWKSAGWVAGIPYLDKNFTIRAGLVWKIKTTD